jgi:hypothetical protein
MLKNALCTSASEHNTVVMERYWLNNEKFGILLTQHVNVCL